MSTTTMSSNSKRIKNKAHSDIVLPEKQSKNSKDSDVVESSASSEILDIQSDEDDSEEDDLHGFTEDEEDSSDDDNELAELDLGKLPTVAKDDVNVKRKLEKAKLQPTAERGVLFLGRIPHGFYEDQLKAYFAQFGDVTRLRVSRNKKTGKSKHYAFIEFDSLPVAQIVAETMDNYLLMGHILRCKIIPKDKVHPELWVGANRKWRVVPSDRITRLQHNKPRNESQREKASKRLLQRQQAQKRKLEKSGIEYDFDAVNYKRPKSAFP